MFKGKNMCAWPCSPHSICIPKEKRGTAEASRAVNKVKLGLAVGQGVGGAGQKNRKFGEPEKA